IKYQRDQRDANVATIESNQRQIDSLVHDVGDGDAAILNAHATDLMNLQKQYRDAKRRLDATREDLQRHTTGLADKENYTPEQIARVDPQMQYRLNALNDADIAVKTQTGELGPKNRAVILLQNTLAARKKSVEDYAAQFNAANFIENKNDGSGPPFAVPKDLTALESAASALEKEIADQEAKIKEMNQRHASILKLQQVNNQLQAQVNTADQNIAKLQFQKAMGGQFKLVDEGSAPQPAGDRRVVFAALGFVGGGAIPIGFLLLLGLANPRYRYSDETNTETIGLNLLGIMPDLPDRLSDPEQASIAAHCVHQIRTMLQISGGTEERRVFAVTSAAPGDGKTSLTLALGLSYAACGTRTLLIDCDLVGAGLTARMNVNSPDGVLEAIANRSLPEYVRSTDVSDVSILPVGAAQTLHASTLSPAALRRLIDEARKQYDTILIDTGPILGSIEASLVCAAADAVVLTVA